MKWILSKLMLLIAISSAFSIATNHAAMNPIDVVLSGSFMLMAVVAWIVIDSNLLTNKIYRRIRGEDDAKNKSRSEDVERDGVERNADRTTS